MFEDRRSYPRRKETVTLRVVLPDGEINAVTTDIGPTGAFFAGLRHAPEGSEVDVLVRPIGLKIAPVKLRAEVVRVVAAGGPYPPGFAVRWLWAYSEAGSQPIFHVLRKVLHIVGITPERLGTGRRVRFDFPAVGATFDFTASAAERSNPSGLPREGMIREEVVGPRSRSSSSRVAGLPRRSAASVVTSTPGEGVGAVIVGDEDDIDAFAETTPPTFDAMLPDGTRVAPASEMTHVSVAPPEAVAVPEFASRGERDRSGVWSTYTRSSGTAPPRRRTSDVVMSDDLRVAGRRTSDILSERAARRRTGSGHFDPDHPAQASGVFDAEPTAPPSRPRSSTARSGSGVFDAELGGAPTRANSAAYATDNLRPISDIRRMPSESQDVRRMPSGKLQAAPARPASGLSDSPFLERSQIFGRGGRLDTGIGVDVSGVHTPAEVDIPVTFEYDSRFVPAKLRSAATVAVEVEARVAPPMETRFTLNVPVEVEGVWRTVYLHGKLLRTPEPRDSGVAFVMAIERVQEGEYAGAYTRFLQTSQAEP